MLDGKGRDGVPLQQARDDDADDDDDYTSFVDKRHPWTAGELPAWIPPDWEARLVSSAVSGAKKQTEQQEASDCVICFDMILVVGGAATCADVTAPPSP
jgi:hypothetical protein